MALQQSQQVSPADSLLSAPCDSYTSLFDSCSPEHNSVMMEMMSPESYTGERSDRLSPVPEDQEQDAGDEKKSTKKRKSWGQVLPEPKTNLPPRKRAKTDDEKEQRRVERVLRNRRAAQSSRERKRLEVEALEQRNEELEAMLLSAQKANLILVEQLGRLQRDSGVVTRAPSSLDSLCDNQITLSPELFCSQDGHTADARSADDLVNEFLMAANPTVNPIALSPELGPKKEAIIESKSLEQTETTSPDLTQYPAAMLSDLQFIPKLEDSDVASFGLDSTAQDAAPFSISNNIGLSTAAHADRYVLESGLLASPESSTFDDDYMAGNYSSSFADQSFELFDINEYLNDEANHDASDIMAASNFATADHGLDFKVHDFETQISSLARPLMDATMVALRLVSERGDNQIGNLKRESSGTRDQDCELTRCLRGADLPSKEVLLTLLWTLKKESRRIKHKDGSTTVDELESASQEEPTQTYIPKVAARKQPRRRTGGVAKRYHLS
ncbi:Basic leucine zipper [Cordyceps militaris CM01]|uniref:Basic leucine zipper n=1 Tax=Cordyceps militaris (strain CM01) TaxID=983644 RepID=G3JRZ2_CORMM|nr:Basic leucine zipper [Cordyceps militaris CM01]EGX88638.1 Basic leucine zipper [Cordyceps militaris CM01]